jgi:hypothetical protein
VETYNFKYKDGSRSWGGYADFARVKERRVDAIERVERGEQRYRIVLEAGK